MLFYDVISLTVIWLFLL